jgi:hypothetical protein
LGVDIKLIGNHLIKCGLIKYKVCEKINVLDKDGNEIEEKVLERESHCQSELLETEIGWNNENEVVIQTRYKTIRKWKPMEIWLIFEY